MSPREGAACDGAALCLPEGRVIRLTPLQRPATINDLQQRERKQDHVTILECTCLPFERWPSCCFCEGCEVGFASILLLVAEVVMPDVGLQANA